MPPFDNEQQRSSAGGFSRTACPAVVFPEQHRNHGCQSVSPHGLMVVDVLSDVGFNVTSFSSKEVPNLVREESSDSDSSSYLGPSQTTEAGSTSSSAISPMSRKQVHFYPYGESVHIATLDEYTDEEIAQCWYSEEELEGIRDINQYIIRLDNNGRLHSSNEVLLGDSTRGLEPQTHQGYLAMRKIRRSSVACVLLEQRRQQMLGVTHHDLIREVYQPFSMAATKTAIQQAEKDVKESLTNHNDPLSCCLEQYFSSCENRKSDAKNKEPTLCWGLLNPSSWLPKSTIASMILLHD